MKNLLLLYFIVFSFNIACAFSYNGLSYSVKSEEDMTCTVTGGSIKSEIVIPEYAYNASTDKEYKVVEIASNAFSSSGTNYYTLRMVSISNTVETIKSGAFAGHYNLALVILGENVSNIADRAFYCSSNTYRLYTIISKNPTPPTLGSTTVFHSYSTDNAVVIVPEESVSDYQKSWKSFSYISPDSYLGYGNNSGEDKTQILIPTHVYLARSESQQLSTASEKEVAEWSVDDSDIAEITEEGTINPKEFGNTLVYAKDENGELIECFEVFVCPTLTVVHGDGVLYSHHVQYNTCPTIYLVPGSGYDIAGVTHDGVNIADDLIANDGKYVPANPITDDSVINLSLVESDKDTTTGSGSVMSDSNVRIYVSGHNVLITGKETNAVVTMTDLAGKELFRGMQDEINVTEAGIYIITIENEPYPFKILVK